MATGMTEPPSAADLMNNNDATNANLFYFPPWLVESDSWTVLIIASLTLFWYARNFPPGPSFTYAWLWVGVLSTVSRSTDANALFYLIGFGLITGWYTTQILQRDIWDRLLVYWLKMWPSWCVSTAVRLGDFGIHILPFAYSLQFYQHVAMHHVFQAVVYERVYFMAIENSIIGTGQVANKIYALHPPCGPHVFRCIQMLSTVGYFFASTVCAGSGRQFLQALWLSLYVFIGFGTVGYFDSVTAKIPKNKESLLTFLLSWDEVNGKASTCLQNLRDAFAQSLVANSPSSKLQEDWPPARALALVFALLSSPATGEEESHSSLAADPAKSLDVMEFTQLINGKIAKESHQAEEERFSCKAKPNGASTASSECLLTSGTQTDEPAQPALQSFPAASVQSLMDKIRNLESIVSKLKASCAAQTESLASASRCTAGTTTLAALRTVRRPNKHAADLHKRFARRRFLSNSLRRTAVSKPGSRAHPSECSTRPSSQNTHRFTSGRDDESVATSSIDNFVRGPAGLCQCAIRRRRLAR
eukprot:Gregarina_sp_Poly_1__9929@NODE_652_length_6929_cov_76_457010_g495_i0_p1_GENE_NODE_652_length_6929_cov_76_457010_g495_i0NODE_652_length_6929_cov_76_457010_g495_i0_p1_ORF_typecomplete_len531_score63_76_NODE_652_length_6929_cov_76_457010_g495_i010722664